MARTDKFRQDHKDIMALLGELKGILNEASLAADASSARLCVSRLLGKLTLHLSAEDRSLYPELAKSSDAALVKLAREFADDMAQTAPKVVEYGRRWPTPTSIKAEPRAFIADTTAMIKTLTSRIQREDRELYAEADRLKRS